MSQVFSDKKYQDESIGTGSVDMLSLVHVNEPDVKARDKAFCVS